jgi:hypothetical protein
VDVDLFDEQAEQFLRLFGAFVGEDLVELVGQAGEGGRVRRRVRLLIRPVAASAPASGTSVSGSSCSRSSSQTV